MPTSYTQRQPERPPAYPILYPPFTMTQVDIYSDYVCPFCYMGFASVERARQQLPLDVTWRAFELRPAGSPPMDPAYRDRIEENWPRVQAMGRSYGVDFAAPLRIGVNSRAAHRAAKIVARLAPEVADTYHRALFYAHFTEGRDISDHDVLVALATAHGVDGTAVREALAANEGLAQVRDEQAAAREMGIGGVPAFLFEGGYLATGAMPAEQLLAAVTQVRQALNEGQE